MSTTAGAISRPAPQAVERLLAPMEPDAFFRDFWEQRYCVISRGNAGHYAGLLTARDVDALLHHYLTATPGARVTLVKNAENDARRRPAPMTASGLLDINALYDAYHDGSTLVVDAVHARWPAIAALCHNLEAFLHFTVGANLYVTPRGAQGFAPHYDSHDVFVLQLSGSKAWCLYDAGEPLPMADKDSRVSPDELGPPIGEFVLRQGDLLYIPRGVVHEATTTDDSSVHLSVGIHVLRVADLLRESILMLAEKDIRLRKALPVGMLAGDDGQALDAHVTEILRDCMQNVTCRDVLQSVGARLVQQREPIPDGHFESLDRLHALETGTYVRRRAGMCSTAVTASTATITFRGRSVIGPRSLERAFRFVEHADVFQVRDLPGPEWAPLSDNAQVVLAKRLVRAGLLGICEALPD